MEGLNVLYRQIDELLELRARDFPRRVEPTWSRLRARLDELTERLRSEAARQDTPAPPVGGQLLDSAIFVVGYPKSGTTLLLGLLDGHPGLAVVPGETRYFTDLLPAARGSRERVVDDLHRRFVLYLVNPSGQSPFWLLGRPWEGDDGYLRFTRALFALARAHPGRDLLALFAATFAHGAPRAWVEKTPLHVEHVDEILAVYPRARFVQVVRDPRSAAASIHRFREHGWSLDPNEVVRGIDRALRAALEHPRRLGEERYLVVRYEELVRSPEPELARIAAFAGIDWDESLLRPTLVGKEMRANSAWLERRTVGEIHALSLDDPGAGLDRRVLRSVLATTGASARALGYPLPRLRRRPFARARDTAGPAGTSR
jgi:hypothetical protein